MPEQEVVDFLEEYRKQFDEVYPDAEIKTVIQIDGDEILKIGRLDACWDCGRMTRWVSTSFHAPLCSKPCVRNKWKEYWEAVSK